MAAATFRRRVKLIDSRVQIGLALKVLLCLGLYLLVFCMMALAAPIYVVISGSGTEAEVAAASDRLTTAAEVFLVPLAFAFACVGLHSILMLHRLAGPLFRFRRTFDEVRERDLSTTIGLRRGDYLTDLAERYNLAAEVLRGDLQKTVDAARGLISELEEADSADPAVGAARTRAKEILATVDAWRLARDDARPDEAPSQAPEVSEEAGVGAP